MPQHTSHQPALAQKKKPPHKARVLQLSTVHPWDDNRICRKICVSLVEDGYDVILMAREARSDESIVPEGVELHVLPTPKNRIRRGLMSLGIWRRARRLRPDIVHFHDPELIPAAIFLRVLGYKVIYDVHEDYPEKIRTKHWVPPAIRQISNVGMTILEKIGTASFSNTFVVTEYLQKRFSNHKTRLLRNFPLCSELATRHTDHSDDQARHVIYVGGLDEDRGVMEMLDGFEAATTKSRRLELLGTSFDTKVNDRLREASKSEHIVVHGWCTREVVKDRLSKAIAGLVLLRPTTTYLDSLPTKMFEYMATGLPVIASDFPLWRETIQDQNCGMLVDPTNVTAIAAAIDWMYQNPEEARLMGENGRRAIQSKLNWESEAKNLHEVYDVLAMSLRRK